MPNLNKRPIVFLDLDGVIVDLWDGTRKAIALPASRFDLFHQNPANATPALISHSLGGATKLEEFFSNSTPQFWASLEMFPWSVDLINMLLNNYEVAFLSNPSHNPNIAAGKTMWHSSNYPDIPLILTREKYYLAGPSRILIDDLNTNLSEFREYGGVGLQWPSQFANLDYIQKYIKTIPQRIEFELQMVKYFNEVPV